MVKVAVMAGVFLDAIEWLFSPSVARGSEKRGTNQRENAINRMFSFRTFAYKRDGEETRDEGKLKFRDTERTLIGRGTTSEMSSNRNDLIFR